MYILYLVATRSLSQPILTLRLLLILSVFCLSIGYAEGGGIQVKRMCASRQHTQTNINEGSGTYHWEEHVLPEEVLRHELSEVSKVS